MALSTRFIDAPREYKREDEQLFRRELENAILQLESRLMAVAAGEDTDSSLHSMTRSFIFNEIGQETIT